MLRATMLALLGAVVLAPAAPAQISFEVTVQLPGDAGDLRIPLLTAKASVPDISDEELLGCMDVSASCLDEVWSLEAPQTEAPAPQSPPKAAPTSRGSSPPARARAQTGPTHEGGAQAARADRHARAGDRRAAAPSGAP